MTYYGFLLVLISLFSHAYWNLLAKKSPDKNITIALSKIAEVVMFLPVFLYFVYVAEESLPTFSQILVPGTFVFINYLFLTLSYKHLDMAIAYPISRSSALFVPFFAYLLVGETIDSIGWSSILIVTIGVFLLGFDFSNVQKQISKIFNWKVIYPLGACISLAFYSAWDKKVIETVHPFLYFYSYTFLVAAFYSIWLITCNKNRIKDELTRGKSQIIQIGFCNTFTKVLILIAMLSCKASYVSCLRQLSLVVGLFFGWYFLKEYITKYKILGTLLLIVGGLLTLVAG